MERNYTERDEELLAALDLACQDYTTDEVLLAFARKIHLSSYEPFEVPDQKQVQATLTEGFRWYRDAHERGYPRETALLIAAGFLGALARHYRQVERRRQIPVE